MENPSLKTQIFKAMIGSNMSIWIQKEVWVGTRNFKRNIKGKTRVGTRILKIKE